MSCSKPLVDAFNRRVTYLRLSVTDRCDLRCSYCMPEKMTFLPRKDVLSLEELHKLSLAMIERGISKIRLTGGEPLVRRDMIELVRALGRKLGDGLDELTLTTNGTQLENFAEDLFAAGVRRINVSLDTMDGELFQQLSRRDRLNHVLRGIAAARSSANWSSRVPLVVRVSSSSPSPSLRPSAWTSSIMSRRTRGSPPVRRILVMPRSIIANDSLCSSSRLSTSLRGRNFICSGMQ